MTSDEIRAAIERLEKYDKDDYSVDAFMCRFMGGKGWLVSELRDALVGLLRQADPDMHIELPKDANGEVINVGDELCGYGYPDGDMHCQAVINDSMILAGRSATAYKSWLMWSASEVHHCHKPTIEDVLCEMLEKAVGFSDAHTTVALDVIAEYAGKLREVMTDE